MDKPHTSIGLWLDSTGNKPVWVVSFDGDETAHTEATFPFDDYDGARHLAEKRCQITGYPVVQTDRHGNREIIYSIDKFVETEQPIVRRKAG